MGQVTEFPVFPNIKPKQYASILNQLAGYLTRDQPGFRALREQLRTWNIWDKAVTKDVLKLLVVPTEDTKKVQPGELLRRMMDVDDETGQFDLMFRFFMDRNPMLLKTIYTALDTENDGRIQSTNELYRIITSYVYPGDAINLPSFRGWIKWMESIEVIKMVGIRWGFGDTGSRHLEKIRQMDIDEILEDEEEGIPSDWETGNVTAAAPAAATSEPAARVGEAVVASKDEVEEGFEEDLPDMAPEAPLPDEEVIRAAEEALGIEGPAETESADGDSGDVVVLPPPGATRSSGGDERAARLVSVPDPHPRSGRGSVRPGSAPPAPMAPVAIAPVFARGATGRMVETTDEDRFANAERVRKWWVGYVYRHPYRAHELGVPVKRIKGKQQLFAEVAVAGLFAHRVEGTTASRSVLDAVRESGWYGGKGSQSLVAGIQEAGLLGLVAGDDRFIDLLPKIMQVSLALEANPCTFKKLAKMGPDKAIQFLYETVYGRVDPLAPFWVVREGILGGWMENPEMQQVACVPSAQTRAHGLRLGFLDQLYAHSIEELIEAARHLSRYFGPDTDFNAPLDHLQDQLGCRFRCPEAAGCDYHCREKTAW